VTGLIKANVPSRIAFAMASMIDSRTVLDAPGAEDLIGRGDMLYQPVDLPRPVRMQGVFVGDREVGEITRHWLDQTGGRTFYDEDILAFGDAEDGNGGDGGQFGWLRKYGVDEMTVPAAELVATSQRASTSMLQTKLKLGFARASRVMDELERYGIIGPQDPRNPASPAQIYGRTTGSGPSTTATGRRMNDRPSDADLDPDADAVSSASRSAAGARAVRPTRTGSR
jgi:S-DNA-T family DNA segregation ATPase FtsK/SpoIIIE